MQECSTCSIPHMGAMDRGQEHSLLLEPDWSPWAKDSPGMRSQERWIWTRAPWLQGKVLPEPRCSRRGAGTFPGTHPNSCRGAKLLELSKGEQSSWPSGKTDGTKTQQGCRALHSHQIRFLHKEYVSLRCQVSGQNGLKCFETAFENWTYPKQNHLSPQVSTRLSVHYLLLTIQSFLAAT